MNTTKPTFTPEETASLAGRIVSMVDYSRTLYREPPRQGQFLVTGAQQGRRDALSKLGFCVQVRLGVGQFGSDIVFMRHAAGNLNTHENQSFIPMSEEQEALARQLFASHPEDEDYGLGYRCADGVHEVGHIIESSASRAALNEVVVMVTVSSGDGTVSSTAFI